MTRTLKNIITSETKYLAEPEKYCKETTALIITLENGKPSITATGTLQNVIGCAGSKKNIIGLTADEKRWEFKKVCEHMVAFIYYAESK